MNRKLILLFLLALVAATSHPSSGLAIEYLGIDFSQDVAVKVSDGIGDPGSSSVESYWVKTPSDFFAPWPADVSLLAASVSRIGHNGLTATASSASLATYQIDPFSLASGFMSIFQVVDTQGYRVDDNHVGYTYARVGMAGDAIGLQFRVDESDGDVVLRIRSAWTNSALGGGQGWAKLNAQIISSSAGEVVSIPIAAGEHRLELVKFGFDAGYDSLVTGHLVSSWTFDGTFPGETPFRPYTMIAVHSGDDDEPFPATDPDNVAGIKVTFSVADESGYSNPAFVGLPTRVNGGPSAGALVTGYEVESVYSPISSVTVPELPANAAGLTIDSGSGPQSVVAGQTIDLGPEGLQSFTLAGFDPEFSSAALDAFVMGLRFAEEGVASLVATPTLYIPPGDLNANGLVDAADYVAWRKNDGTQAGYDTWRANFGKPTGSSAGLSSVPEPSTLLLAVAALAALSSRRHQPSRNRE